MRYFNAAGADPDGEIRENHEPETHVIPLAIHAALGRLPRFQVFGTDYPTPDGSAIRDYVHVSDLADAHVRALEYLVAGGASIALNLGTGQGHSVLQVVAAVEAETGQRITARADGATSRRSRSAGCRSCEGPRALGLDARIHRPAGDRADRRSLGTPARRLT